MSKTDDIIWIDGSPRIDFLKLSHKRAGIMDWNNDRVARLCTLLGCTLPELAAAAGVYDEGKVRNMKINNSYPPPVALHFDRFEKAAYESFLGKPHTIEPDIAFAKAFGNQGSA